MNDRNVCCVYKFVDYNNNVLYVGSTDNLRARLIAHTHLKYGVYEKVKYVYYIQTENITDARIYEIYYINYYQSCENKIDKYIYIPTIKFDYIPEWILYNWDFKNNIEIAKRNQESLNKYESIFQKQYENTLKNFNL